MKNKERRSIGTWLAAAALVLVTLAGFASAAGEGGTASDPLVSLGYLNQVYKPAVLAELDTSLALRDAALQNDFSLRLDAHLREINTLLAGTAATPPVSGEGNTGATFGVVTLENGRALVADAGTEIMLRAGAAVCEAGSLPGLIDLSGGSELNPGYSLAPNHLYLATEQGRGVRVSSDTATLLVRGGYSLA